MDALGTPSGQDTASGTRDNGHHPQPEVRFEVEDWRRLLFEVEEMRRLFQVEDRRTLPQPDPSPPEGPEAVHRFLALMNGGSTRPVQQGPAHDMAWLSSPPRPTGTDGQVPLPANVQAAVQEIHGWLSREEHAQPAKAAALAQAVEATTTTPTPTATATATTDHQAPGTGGASDGWLKPLVKVAFGFGAVLAVSALAILFLTITYAWMTGWEPVTIYANLLGEGRLEALVLGIGLFFAGGMLFHYLSFLKRW